MATIYPVSEVESNVRVARVARDVRLRQVNIVSGSFAGGADHRRKGELNKNMRKFHW